MLSVLASSLVDSGDELFAKSSRNVCHRFSSGVRGLGDASKAWRIASVLLTLARTGRMNAFVDTSQESCIDNRLQEASSDIAVLRIFSPKPLHCMQ